ncbi:MAG: flavin reductase family protein [Rhodoferax sp.]
MPVSAVRAYAKSPQFSSEDFRAALGQFATGVTIVTACLPSGQRVGLTANSFNSVSLTPPLVLWSLAQASSTLALFREVSHYAINVLAADQKPLAQRFAMRDIDRFEGVDFARGQTGALVLDDAVAVFECFNRSRYAEGDHVIFVGEVEHCRHRPGVAPLVYHAGRFHTRSAL